MRNGQIDSYPLRYHSKSNIRSRRVGKSDIVFEVSGGSKGQPVGRALLINKRLLRGFGEDVICASFCKLLQIGYLASTEFLYMNLDRIYSDVTIDKYQVQSTGITNFKFAVFLEDHHVPLPPKPLMEQFTEMTAALLDQISVLGFRNANLRHTRDLLLPKLISGEIDVPQIGSTV